MGRQTREVEIDATSAGESRSKTWEKDITQQQRRPADSGCHLANQSAKSQSPRQESKVSCTSVQPSVFQSANRAVVRTSAVHSVPKNTATNGNKVSMEITAQQVATSMLLSQCGFHFQSRGGARATTRQAQVESSLFFSRYLLLEQLFTPERLAAMRATSTRRGSRQVVSEN